MFSSDAAQANLRRLALSLVQLKFVRKSTQVFTVSQVNCICVKFTAFCDLGELASGLANPFVHPGASPYASSGFANLRRLDHWALGPVHIEKS